MRRIKPRALFFDAAGTLLHIPRGVGWHYRQVALRHGCDLSEADLNREFVKAWKGQPAPVETRARREDDDKEWWREVVSRVLDGVQAPGIFDRAAYFEELYLEFVQRGVWELFPEVETVLWELAPRYELGIVSNFDGRLRIVLEALGVAGHFRHWVISSEVGADKPSLWPFQCALEMAGVPPGEALHAGDSPTEDWDAAAAAGLQVFRLQRPHNSLEDLAASLR